METSTGTVKSSKLVCLRLGKAPPDCWLDGADYSNLKYLEEKTTSPVPSVLFFLLSTQRSPLHALFRGTAMFHRQALSSRLRLGLFPLPLPILLLLLSE